jgi:hypothetical protein
MKFYQLTSLICCITLSSCMLPPGGGGRSGGGIKVGGHAGNPATAVILGAGIVIGSIIASLPRKHVAVKNDLYLSEGVYYQHTNDGYLVVKASVGTWVNGIPAKHDVVRVNNNEYHRYQSNWYRFDSHRKQYQVVDNPMTE